MTDGIKGNTTGHVWLVWDGPGGRVFEVCADKRSAAVVRKFHRRYPNIAVLRFEVKEWEAWK